MAKRRVGKYPLSFRQMAVERMRDCPSVSALAKELGITYIRLQTGFVYLAVILDSYSRKVVGWKLDRALTSRLAADALESAIELRRPLPGLVHHSDRGVQYTSPEYIAILKLHGMV